MAGAGIVPSENLRIEGGWALFQQDQIKNVQNTNNPLYGEIINAMGYTGQVSYKTRDDMEFFQSADLRLYQNDPDAPPRKYIRHRQLDEFWCHFPIGNQRTTTQPSRPRKYRTNLLLKQG